MRRVPLLFGAFLLTILWLSEAAAAGPVHHDLRVTLDPASGKLEVEDTLTFPHAVSEIRFTLHAGLEPSSDSADASLVPEGEELQGVAVRRYRLTLSGRRGEVHLRYHGRIQDTGDTAATAGTISPEGVFLAASSAWYPQLQDTPLTFTLQTKLPPGWQAVSQGRPMEEAGNIIGWTEDDPQEEIYLIAGKYRFYHRGGPVEAQVYLHRPDPALAERYLDATLHYLDLYSRLIGPYPYAKFALVENFWESGYGMPSFTLLGPGVIRLPFILHSSYPHEILHNWWGNGVYVDYANGNWSEGLTSYLADHLLKEQQGQGAAYRRDTLQRYADYVALAQDFPLSRFLTRHNEASQAVGYGRGLMLFHMLRRQLGDKNFLAGLRRFYRDYRFQPAGFRDLRTAFEAVSRQNLSTFFRQWIERTGAPALAIDDIKLRRTDSGFLLSVRLRQTQPEPPFRLRIPIAVLLQGERQPRWQTLKMNTRELRWRTELPARPLRLALDPLFDLFRRLDPGEIPSSLGQLFGAERLTVLLPSAASPDLKQAYRELAQSWAVRGQQIDIAWDDSRKELPPHGKVWLFGKENRFASSLVTVLPATAFQNDKQGIMIAGDRYQQPGHSFVLTGRRPDTLGWLVAANVDAIPLLARKLPHYGKYSYLVFRGPEQQNVGKGQWRPHGSALQLLLPGAPTNTVMPLPEPPPLSELVGNGSP